MTFCTVKTRKAFVLCRLHVETTTKSAQNPTILFPYNLAIEVTLLNVHKDKISPFTIILNHAMILSDWAVWPCWACIPAKLVHLKKPRQTQLQPGTASWKYTPWCTMIHASFLSGSTCFLNLNTYKNHCLCICFFPRQSKAKITVEALVILAKRIPVKLLQLCNNCEEYKLYDSHI